MPITFDCPECGKACRAPAEMAGRKAKCQDCKAIITVPAEDEQVAEKPLPKRKAVPAVADDEDDEKPRAKKSRKDDDEEEEKPRAKKSRKDDDEEENKPRKQKSRKDDEEEEEDDSPRAKKKRQYHDEDDSPKKKAKPKGKKSGSSMGLVLMLGGAALALGVLCGGGGLLVWWLWFSGASEMAFAPDDCTQIQVVHVNQMENSPAYKAFAKQDSRVAKEQAAAPGNYDAIKQAGVDSVFTASSNEGEVSVVKTKKDITDADLVKGRTYKDVKAGKYTMHEGALEAVCLVDGTTVVYSSKPSLLKKVLERGKAPELSAGMKKAQGYANRSKSISSATAKSSTGGGGGRGVVALPFGTDQAQGIECSGGFMHFDSDIHFEVTSSFKDSQSAEAAKKKTEDDIKKLVDGIEATMKLLGKANADNPMKEMFQAIHVTVSGSEVHIEATWSTALIERVEKAQNDLKGGIGDGPGPGGKPR